MLLPDGPCPTPLVAAAAFPVAARRCLFARITTYATNLCSFVSPVEYHGLNHILRRQRATTSKLRNHHALIENERLLSRHNLAKCHDQGLGAIG